MSLKFKSHVALPDDAKQALVETLNTALATTNDLHSQVKTYK
jgi:DNA-binding ferritin-like protein